MWNVMKTCFETTARRLRRGGWQKIFALNEYAQKLPEPTVQEMTGKEKERSETNLHGIRIVATCVKQMLEEKGCEGYLPGMWVCIDE